MGLCDTVSTLKVFLAFFVSAIGSYGLLILLNTLPEVVYVEQTSHPLRAIDRIEHVVFDSREIATSIRHVPIAVSGKTSVAIGMGISTRKMKINFEAPSIKEMKSLPFFKLVLPSFCKTCSVGYTYRIYITFDYNDPLLSVDQNKDSFKRIFQDITKSSCLSNHSTDLILIKCNHSKKPAWAQNDAMMAAYMDNNTYYYRVNDDTILSSQNWTEKFIDTLQKYKPPNVGVVGPRCSMGNTKILTYDFVHRTHVDMFGYYYPRKFEGWHADRWISDVYKPGRMTKLKGVSVRHVESLGQRYPSHKFKKDIVYQEITKGKSILERYVEDMNNSAPTSTSRKSSQHVISFSMSDNTDSTYYGLVRNAVLAKLYYPTWTVQLILSSSNVTNFPKEILNKLTFEGVQILQLDASEVQLPSNMLRHLVVDNPGVEHFLVRDSQSRLSRRESSAVEMWLSSNKAVHCIRDHPQDVNQVVMPSYWGGVAQDIRKVLGGVSFKTTLEKIFSSLHRNSSESDEVLEQQVFQALFTEKKWIPYLYCHDSISCSTDTVNFPLGRQGTEYIGQHYDSFEMERSSFPNDHKRKCS